MLVGHNAHGLKDGVKMTVRLPQDDEYQLTNPLSSIDTVILDIGVARVWPLITINPVDRASKGCTALVVQFSMSIMK